MGQKRSQCNGDEDGDRLFLEMVTMEFRNTAIVGSELNENMYYTLEVVLALTSIFSLDRY